MILSFNHATLSAYAVACVVLCLNLIVLWVLSGATRSKTGIAINAEDAATFKLPLGETDPPAVARVLRAHANAQANIVPFLFLGLVYVLAGGSAGFAQVVFSIFCVARIAHSVVYIKAMQPARTITFIAGGLATLALAGDVIWMLFKG